MKTTLFILSIIMTVVVLGLGGCASELNKVDKVATVLHGQPADIEQRLEKAAKFPLGSQDNPIRAFDPKGERTYLQRLRCHDGNPPVFRRLRNIGVGVFNHIIDEYLVECPNSEPLKAYIYMDMYFRDYTENRAPEGFTIVPEPLRLPSSHGA